LSNAAGALISVIVLFNHPLPIILAVVGMALASGLVGGFLSFGIYKSIKEMRII
jgi:hypothetical protein